MSIRIGRKFADLVVMEKNLFERAPREDDKSEVLVTVMNGKVVHERHA